MADDPSGDGQFLRFSIGLHSDDELHVRGSESILMLTEHSFVSGLCAALPPKFMTWGEERRAKAGYILRPVRLSDGAGENRVANIPIQLGGMSLVVHRQSGIEVSAFHQAFWGSALVYLEVHPVIRLGGFNGGIQDYFRQQWEDLLAALQPQPVTS